MKHGGNKVPFVPHPQKHGGDLSPCPPPKQGPWVMLMRGLWKWVLDTPRCEKCTFADDDGRWWWWSTRPEKLAVSTSLWSSISLASKLRRREVSSSRVLFLPTHIVKVTRADKLARTKALYWWNIWEKSRKKSISECIFISMRNLYEVWLRAAHKKP